QRTARRQWPRRRRGHWAPRSSTRRSRARRAPCCCGPGSPRSADAWPVAGGARGRPKVVDVTFTLLPAVDVADGKAVRLVQGAAGTETEYGSPREAALAWQRDGAEWIHLVDLDAAFGRGNNHEPLAAVVGELDVNVELSGGIRDDESLAAALATGARRINLGTAALEDPEWTARVIGEHGDRVAIGLDVRITGDEHRLAARGWTSDG